MKVKPAGTLAIFAWFVLFGSAFAQDLGPQIRKLKDGIYVYVGKNNNSNCGIILTREGVVLVDTGQTPTVTCCRYVSAPRPCRTRRPR